MRKILTSLLVISAMVAIVTVGTRALFSDTEKSIGNAFTTGTIDIAVNGENPWIAKDTMSLVDMKPSQTGYITFVVHNVGSNPANLWKTLKNFNYQDVETSEPECKAEGGTWNGSCTGNRPVFNIASKIKYDMRVELYNENPVEDVNPVWWETIYMDKDGFTLNQLDKMYLGMVPANWYMKVIQSYHMDENTGNKYQGDSMTFDIELYAEQLTNTVRLVRKYEADTDISHHVWDGDYADFSYKVKDDVLRWTLDTNDVPDKDYTLLVWDDSSDYDFEWPMNAVVLAHITDSGDTMTHTGEIDLEDDLVNAKVWLVPTKLGSEVGDIVTGFNWNALNEGTYFETGLIDYYDSL